MDWIDASPHVVKDLEEAMDYVWGRLSVRGQQEFREAVRDELWHFHHGLGRALRNELGLWEEVKPAVQIYFEDQLGVTHPDDISGIIIEALHCRVHGVAFDLAAKVQHYKDYWSQKETP